MSRLHFITYKNTEIKCYSGSNYAYINNRPFESLLSAKRWITKQAKLNAVKIKPIKLIINQSAPYQYSRPVTNHLRVV